MSGGWVKVGKAGAPRPLVFSRRGFFRSQRKFRAVAGSEQPVEASLPECEGLGATIAADRRHRAHRPSAGAHRRYDDLPFGSPAGLQKLAIIFPASRHARSLVDWGPGPKSEGRRFLTGGAARKKAARNSAETFFVGSQMPGMGEPA